MVTQPPPRAAPLHVLVIEDYADGRETLRLLLELSGFRVDSAASGTEGVEKALALRPHAALVDIGLPGLNGYEVARELRRRLGDRIHLAACTAYGQPEDIDAAEAAGFDKYLVKPVNTDELLTWLRSLA